MKKIVAVSVAALFSYAGSAQAQGAYDGVYLGQTTSDQPGCGPAATHLLVQNGQVYYGVNHTPGGAIGDDGSFSYQLVSARGLNSYTKARISNGVVEGQTVVPGECVWRYHAVKVSSGR